MVFERLKNRFRERGQAREEEKLEASSGSRKPSSGRRQNVPDESIPDRRSSRRTSGSNARHPYGNNGRISKRPSTSNLSSSRLELRRVAAEEEIAKQRLGTVNEEGNGPILPGSPSRKERLSSQPSPRSSQQAEKGKATLPKDLFDELIQLREQNAVLSAQATSSPKKGISVPDSAQWEEQKRTIDELYAQLRTEKTARKEAERGRTRMVKQLAASTKVESSLYDDAHFKDGVYQLRWQIYNWVKNVRWDYPNRNRSRRFEVPTAYKFLRNTCLNYQEYLSTRKRMELLIQAHIWQYFVLEVFREPCFWAETREPGEAESDISNNPFSSLRGHLRTAIPQEDEEAFQSWRYSSVRLLAKRDPKAIDESIAHAARLIMTSLTQNFKHIHTGDSHLRSLETIFRSAINLDYLMQQQRADYTFFPIGNGGKDLLFDGERMKVFDEEEDREEVSKRVKTVVRLVIEPAFCKFGDSKGGNYGVSTCLLKGEVDI